MDNNGFINNLREALKKYNSALDNGISKNAQSDLDNEMLRKNGLRMIGDAALAASGAVSSAGISSGHPVVMGAGAGLGLLNALAGNAVLAYNEKYHTGERKRILDEYQKAIAERWTDYKNDSIKDASNGRYTVGDLAKEGKMVDDDGNIVDIDYDYYKTVPYETLNRVFGKDGANAVRYKILTMNKK